MLDKDDVMHALYRERCYACVAVFNNAVEYICIK